MSKLFAGFWTQEDGAVTVDWVVLTAAIVGICLGIIASISVGTNSLSSKTSMAISDVAVGERD